VPRHLHGSGLTQDGAASGERSAEAGNDHRSAA
jgi:hypothetical protein